eukprot:3933370-Rhodomonas_salina.1
MLVLSNQLFEVEGRQAQVVSAATSTDPTGSEGARERRGAEGRLDNEGGAPSGIQRTSGFPGSVSDCPADPASRHRKSTLTACPFSRHVESRIGNSHRKNACTTHANRTMSTLLKEQTSVHSHKKQGPPGVGARRQEHEQIRALKPATAEFSAVACTGPGPGTRTPGPLRVTFQLRENHAPS